MKNGLALLFLVAALTALPFTASAKEGDTAKETATMEKAQTGDKGMKMPCMGMSKDMMKDMKAMDEKLDEKVAAMNKATGERKLDVMAAIINELVTERKEMHKKMEQMHGNMMGGNMGEMMDGKMNHGAEAAKTDADHSKHQHGDAKTGTPE